MAATLGQDWEAYFGGVAAFAGTLFALVLAARQIRRPLVEDPHKDVSQAYLLDSIAVTVELGAAAAFAVLFAIREEVFFSYAAAVVAVCGIAASGAAPLWFFRVRSHLNDSAKSYARLQWLSVVPIACYAFVLLYALRSPQAANSGESWYAAAVSWLCFSGTVQAIWWYARMWSRAESSESRG